MWIGGIALPQVVTGPGGGSGGFTTGSVVFADASGALNQDNANFFWDDTNNRLGIGTASPSSPLHVTGSISPAVAADAAGVTFASTIVEAASGVHARLAGVNITAPTITAAAATVTTGSTLYVSAAPTLTSTNAYAIEAGGATTLVSAAGLQYATVAIPSHTVTLTGTTQVTSSPGAAGLSIGTITVTDGSAVTVDNAAAIYVAAAPVAAGSAVITNSYSIWADSGTARFDGVLQVADGSVSSPGIQFQADTNTGFYRSTGDTIVATLGGAGRMILGAFAHIFSQTAAGSSTPTMMTFTGAAHTNQTASTEAIDVNFNMARTVQHATGAITTQRTYVMQAATHGFVGASTITNAVTFEITNAPAAGTNATITTAAALRVGATDFTLGPTSAGMNYAAIRVPTHTITVTGTTQVTASPAVAAVSLAQVTITDASAVTVDTAATLYISNAPVGAGSVTLTAAYALWVDAGASRFDGNMGFFSTAPIAQQTSGEDLTNNVTAGGVDGTIADYSSLTVYATDAAAIRNDIYQLARKLKQINDGLRDYGLFT